MANHLIDILRTQRVRDILSCLLISLVILESLLEAPLNAVDMDSVFGTAKFGRLDKPSMLGQRPSYRSYSTNRFSSFTARDLPSDLPDPTDAPPGFEPASTSPTQTRPQQYKPSVPLIQQPFQPQHNSTNNANIASNIPFMNGMNGASNRKVMQGNNIPNFYHSNNEHQPAYNSLFSDPFSVLRGHKM